MTLFWNYLIVFFYDAPEHYQIGFQDAASSLGEEIQWFHDRLFFYFVLVGTVVLWMITQIVLSFRLKKRAITHKYLSLETVLNIISTATLGYIFVTLGLITLGFIFDTLPLIFDSLLFPPFTFPHLMGDMDNILFSQQAVPGGVIEPLLAEPAVDVPQEEHQPIAIPLIDLTLDTAEQAVTAEILLIDLTLDTAEQAVNANLPQLGVAGPPVDVFQGYQQLINFEEISLDSLPKAA